MEQIVRDGREFIGYEYKQINTTVNKVSFLIDGYKNFGWVIDNNLNLNAANIPIVLRLKRNKKIMNKMELTRLERNFEFCLKEIDYFEKSKSQKATMYALSVGIVGTIFMAGSVFAISAEPQKVMEGIILAVPALIGWIFPYFIYKEVKRKRIIKVNPLIEKKLEEIHEICEKGNKLLCL